VYGALTHVIQRHVHTVLSGPARGLRLQGGGTPGYVLGLSERAVQNALVAHLRPGDVYWDVGAHTGFLAVLANRLVGAGGSVHCFEPVPEIARLLEGNLQANGCETHIHELALADRDATGYMRVGERRIAARLADEGLPVSLRRADSLDLPAPNMVKIDVEGAEESVLAGMARVLERHRPVVIVEVHGTGPQIRAQLEGHGYAVRPLDDRGGMPHVIAVPR
jgi:FkbM family methyltransferase